MTILVKKPQTTTQAPDSVISIMLSGSDLSSMYDCLLYGNFLMVLFGSHLFLNLIRQMPLDNVKKNEKCIIRNQYS